jgi:hypothetical protein
MSRVVRSFVSLCCLVAVIGSVGCSGSGDHRTFTRVKGTVTSKGAPIKGEGISLSFTPDNGQAGVTIQVNADGTYEGEAVPGNNKVTVVAYVPLESVGIQKKYTEDGTTLTATLDPKGENTVDFEVGQ